MTNRVALGNRSGSSGLFVSRPGSSVLTAGEDGMLLSPDIQTLQIVENGSFEPGSLTPTFSFVDLGFRPIVIVTRQRGLTSMTYNSNSSITLSLPQGQSAIDSIWTTINKPALSNTVFWAVTNIPAF